MQYEVEYDFTENLKSMNRMRVIQDRDFDKFQTRSKQELLELSTAEQCPKNCSHWGGVFLRHCTLHSVGIN